MSLLYVIAIAKKSRNFLWMKVHKLQILWLSQEGKVLSFPRNVKTERIFQVTYQMVINITTVRLLLHCQQKLISVWSSMVTKKFKTTLRLNSPVFQKVHIRVCDLWCCTHTTNFIRFTWAGARGKFEAHLSQRSTRSAPCRTEVCQENTGYYWWRPQP